MTKNPCTPEITPEIVSMPLSLLQETTTVGPLSPEQHNQTCLSLTYMLQGNAVILLAGKVCVLQEGDLLLQRTYEPLSLVQQTEPSNCVTCLFPASQLAGMATSADSKEKPVEYWVLSGKKKEFSYLFQRILNEIQHSSTPHTNLLSHLFSIIRLKWERCFDREQTRQRNPEKEDLIDFVCAHYQPFSSFGKIKEDVFAEKLRMSSSAFSKLFKKKTGMTFVQFCTELRLLRAARFLVTTKLSVLEIMKAVGYHDSKHFYHVFYQKFQMTPAHFRKTKTLTEELDFPYSKHFIN